MLDESIRRQPMPAINHQHGAINEVSCVRTKKDGGILDVLNYSEATQGNPLSEFLFDRFRNQSLHSFRIADWSRRDRVHADSMTTPLDGEVARQRIHTRLRGGDVKLHRCAEVM